MPTIKTDSCSIGSLLRRATPYTVPRFQRDFSWTEEEVEQLWDDINRAINDGADSYFIGSIVLKDTGNAAAFEVIDGQQRLTTVSLLLCALRDAANSRDLVNPANNVNNHFIANYEFDSDLSNPKITLNALNRQYYQTKIVDGGDIETLTADSRSRRERKSNKLIASAYLFFRKAIDAEIERGKSMADYLREITSVIDRTVQVIEITVQDDYDAYMLFETLNDRGLALSVADLLKNYLFSRAEDRLEDVQENWQEMSSSLASIETKRFLRHYWLSRFAVVRDKDLFKKIKDNFQSKSSIYRFSLELRKAADVYASLYEPSSELWSIFEASEREQVQQHLEDLMLFGVNQYNPLLLSVLDENQTIFPSVLRMVRTFAFRYSIIMGSGTGNIERTFTDAALFVRNNPTCSAKDVFERIEGLYPSDAEFSDAFAERSITQAAVARYILREINNHMEAKSGRIVDKSAFSMNLEHVLPKKFNAEEWQAFSEGRTDVDPEEFKDRLGNMTLLSSGLNRDISNKSFAEKLPHYQAAEALSISEIIFNSEDWTYSKVEQNQRMLAKVAKQVWRVDY